MLVDMYNEMNDMMCMFHDNVCDDIDMKLCVQIMR